MTLVLRPPCINLQNPSPAKVISGLIKVKSRNSLLANSAAFLLGLIGSAASVAAPVLEEVVVTAQLRAQSLQDVPVSVNAVSGDKLFEAGIEKVEDLQAYIPNLTMSETGIGTNIYVRGIGSGINQGFEQSVGLYFDGVSYGRAQLSRAPFMDLARVEVLRGPQNILYGKSSIAGALSLISRRPGEEFEGLVSLTVEPNEKERVYDLVLSGPITDSFGVRLASRVKTTEGYIENLTLDRNEPQRREETVRLVFDWAAADNIQAMLKVEQSDFNVKGRQIEIINDQESVSTTPGFTGNTYAEILDETTIGTFSVDSDSSVLNNTLDFKRSSNGDESNNNIGAYILNVEMNAGEHTFTSISAYLEYDFQEVCDCDFTGADLFTVDLLEDYSQFSQELRWVSPAGGRFEYIGGLYYQTSDLKFFDSINVRTDTIPDLINLADAAGAGERGELFDGIGDAGDELRDFGTPRNFTTEAELYTAFLQSTMKMSDNLRLTLGGRFSYEKKEGSRSLDYSFLSTGESRPIGEVDTAAAVSFKAERHDLSGSFSENSFSPSINLQWYIGDARMAYATLTKGFKAGGFDARSNASPELEEIRPLQNPNRTLTIQGSFQFDREEAVSFELGTKSSFFDGRLELNVAAFMTKYDDLQVSIFDGTLGFNVGNAAAAVTTGIELDGRFAATEHLFIGYALALLDFEFQDYTNGQCYQDRVNAGNGLSNNAPPPDSFGADGTPFCDYDGESNQYVADYSGNLTFAYNRMVNDALEFRGNLDFVFTDDYNPTQNLDPTQVQDGFVKEC